ncbi:LPS export ABC transporter periplasmic protein LptC [Tepidamorphus sp. 3E244]|uniref:LPS export ABC transporter periplasmic protein LptC n=1 Tax=Tepidamorphus sp. 3E244 TaxID=3385498 RepID=UPI0038FC64DC
MNMTDGMDTARAGALPDRRRQRAFRAAKSHTRLVRTLRIGLPVFCVLTIAALSFSGLSFSIRLPEGQFDVDNIGLDGSTLVMESPKLSGYRAGRGTYLIKANKAEQDIAQSNIVNLSGLNGKLTQEDGRWATIDAGTGKLDTDTQSLELRDRIIVRADGGYRAVLDDADVDMKSGRVVTEKPVKVDMLNGSLAADRMTITESGRAMAFEGRVKLRVILGVPAGPLPGGIGSLDAPLEANQQNAVPQPAPQ